MRLPDRRGPGGYAAFRRGELVETLALCTADRPVVAVKVVPEAGDAPAAVDYVTHDRFAELADLLEVGQQDIEQVEHRPAVELWTEGETHEALLAQLAEVGTVTFELID